MGIKHNPPYARLNETPMFARRIPPYLRFAEGENDTPPAAPADDLGFPAATPVDDMTADQKAAYWRHEAKKQQKRADKFDKLGDPDKIRADLDAAEQAAEDARRAAQSEHERALEDARKEGRDEAAAEASGKWLKDAVQSHIALLAQAPGETPEDTRTRVNGVLQYIDPTQFIGDDGALDADKLTNFANSLGTGAPATPEPSGNPLLTVLRRQNTPEQGAGGSVASFEQAAYDRLKKK